MKRELLAAVSVFCCVLLCSNTVFADSTKVVTIGADLSAGQKNTMYEYFGVKPNQVLTIEVNNQDERKYLEGVASEETIGTRTFSSAYVEPTTSGGIQVKTANLTWVTSNMIASTLSTSGVTNCNVVAASPIEVSGTGALTGIMMAYEQATDEKLDENKKQLASDELIYSSELGDEVGTDEAVLLINAVKTEVLENNITDIPTIQAVISNAAEENEITLSPEKEEKLTNLISRMAELDYDYDSIKETLNRVEQNVSDVLDKFTPSGEETKNFFVPLWEGIKNFFKNLFGGNDAAETEGETVSEDSILNNTNDGALGNDVKSDATNSSVLPPAGQDDTERKQMEEKQTEEEQAEETRGEEAQTDQTKEETDAQEQ